MSDVNLNPIQILLIIIIPSFVAGLPAIISAVGAWKNKRRRSAESLNEEGTAAEKVSIAWEKVVGELQIQIDKLNLRQDRSDEEQKKLNIRVNRQKKRILYLEDGVQILIKQLKGLGVDPDFILKDEEGE